MHSIIQPIPPEKEYPFEPEEEPLYDENGYPSGCLQ